MPVRVTCSECDKKLQIRDEAVGKKVKCPGCGGIFVAKAQTSAAIKAGPARTATTATTRTPPQVKTSPAPQAKRPAPPPPPRDDDDDEEDDDDIDERPARSRRRIKYAKSPNRMVLWLVLGLVVLLGGAAATFFIFFGGSDTGPIAKGNNPLQGGNAPQPGMSLAELVPGESYAFATLSGELWDAPALAPLRQGFAKEAEAGFEKEIGFPISDLDRASVFSVGTYAMAKQSKAPPMVVLVQTKKPVDQNKVTQALKSSQFGKDPTLAIEFLNDQTFVAGQQPMLQLWKDTRGKTKAAGVLERALTQAATSKGVIIAVTIPPEAAQEAKNVPPQAAVLLKARELFASMDVTDKLSLSASLVMEDAASATQAKQTADGFMKLFGPGGFGPGFGGPQGGQGKPPFSLDLKQNDKELTLVAEADANLAVGMMLPAIQKLRTAAVSADSNNNLKLIGLAWHNYASAYRTLPPQTLNKGLSWRVAILPYLEEANLYRQFKLDEPWDSPHNRKLIPLMPKVYALPGADSTTGRTHYQTFVGPKTINANPQKPMSFAQITDGTTNTIIVAEGMQPVEWTKPDDIVVNPSQPIMLGAPTSATPTTPVLMADGSVRPLPRLFDQKMLRSLLDPADGMVVQIP